MLMGSYSKIIFAGDLMIAGERSITDANLHESGA
jgi:hypothetical protein